VNPRFWVIRKFSSLFIIIQKLLGICTSRRFGAGQHWPPKRPTIFYHDKDYHFFSVALQYYTGMNIAGSVPVL